MDAVKDWTATLPESLKKEVKIFKYLYAKCVLVEGEPMGKARPRFTRKGRCYTPKATKAAERRTQYVAGTDCQGTPLAGPVGVTVLAVFPIPASWSEKKRQEALAGRIRPAVKPDFDNVAKLYCDALNGIMWEDDKQIVDGRCLKYYGQRPGVMVLSWPLNQ